MHSRAKQNISEPITCLTLDTFLHTCLYYACEFLYVYNYHHMCYAIGSTWDYTHQIAPMALVDTQDWYKIPLHSTRLHFANHNSYSSQGLATLKGLKVNSAAWQISMWAKHCVLPPIYIFRFHTPLVTGLKIALGFKHQRATGPFCKTKQAALMRSPAWAHLKPWQSSVRVVASRFCRTHQVARM